MVVVKMRYVVQNYKLCQQLMSVQKMISAVLSLSMLSFIEQTYTYRYTLLNAIGLH